MQSKFQKGILKRLHIEPQYNEHALCLDQMLNAQGVYKDYEKYGTEAFKMMEPTIKKFMETCDDKTLDYPNDEPPGPPTNWFDEDLIFLIAILLVVLAAVFIIICLIKIEKRSRKAGSGTEMTALNQPSRTLVT
jgi:hypothetical protein